MIYQHFLSSILAEIFPLIQNLSIGTFILIVAHYIYSKAYNGYDIQYFVVLTTRWFFELVIKVDLVEIDGVDCDFVGIACAEWYELY